MEFLAARAIPGVETVTALEYRRTISHDGAAGEIWVRQPRTGSWLDLHIDFPDPRELFRIIERVRRIFDCSADPAEVTSHLKRDGSLMPVVRRRPGLRVPGAWDGFEIAVRAILGQQVSVKGATTLAGRLAAQFGKPSESGVLFPPAEILCDANLQSIGLPAARAESIRAMARSVIAGKVRFDGSVPLEEFERQMREIPGIGSWTAQYVAMRLGEPDAFPAGDLHLRRHNGNAESWRPWRAYAAMYIWKGLS
jgi:AraC family transcriptional regulator of adaptative response / DNA-3-methyladenine glycosylase II